ncbi:hypothetical protein [Salmonella phage NINP13076]|uniref:Uncharacterized protein n=1 Tax=Salmonella phage SalP219 TaxID=3158864 RepID=A0AAU7PIL0_9CAUD|nr:hypothetical protein [Salmonella phage NINP13076]
MKKSMIVLLASLFVAPVHAEGDLGPDMLESYGNGVKDVEARILRKAQLRSDIATANLKIAAFEVEIAKEKLNKSLAEAALVQMEKK